MYFTFSKNYKILCSDRCPKPVFNPKHPNQPLNSSMTKVMRQSFLIQNSKFKQGSSNINFANSGKKNNCFDNSYFVSSKKNLCNTPPPKNSF